MQRKKQGREELFYMKQVNVCYVLSEVFLGLFNASIFSFCIKNDQPTDACDWSFIILFD